MMMDETLPCAVAEPCRSTREMMSSDMVTINFDDCPRITALEAEVKELRAIVDEYKPTLEYYRGKLEAEDRQLQRQIYEDYERARRTYRD